MGAAGLFVSNLLQCCWWQLGDDFLELPELGQIPALLLCDAARSVLTQVPGCCSHQHRGLQKGAALETRWAREPGLLSVLWGLGKGKEEQGVGLAKGRNHRLTQVWEGPLKSNRGQRAEVKSGTSCISAYRRRTRGAS